MHKSGKGWAKRGEGKWNPRFTEQLSKHNFKSRNNLQVKK